MDTPSSILKKLLPGAWPRTIFGMSIVLSAALYKFYPDLPTKWLPISEVERFLWRLIVTGILILTGAIALIASLIHNFNKLKNDFTSAKNTLLSLQEEKNQLTSQNKKHSTQIAQITQMAADFKKQLTNIIALHTTEIEQLKNSHFQQHKKIGQLLEADFRAAQERMKFLATIDAHLHTPQTIEEMKALTIKAEMFARFSELLVKSTGS